MRYFVAIFLLAFPALALDQGLQPIRRQTVGAATVLDISDAGDGTPHKHQIANFPTITCATCTISSVMLVQICRDADQTNGTDDMVGDVAGLSFDCHMPLDSVGSAAEDTVTK